MSWRHRPARRLQEDRREPPLWSSGAGFYFGHVLNHQDCFGLALFIPALRGHDGEAIGACSPDLDEERIVVSIAHARARICSINSGEGNSCSMVRPRSSSLRKPTAWRKARLGREWTVAFKHHQAGRQRRHHFLVIAPLRLHQREKTSDFACFPLLQASALHVISVWGWAWVQQGTGDYSVRYQGGEGSSTCKADDRVLSSAADTVEFRTQTTKTMVRATVLPVVYLSPI